MKTEYLHSAQMHIFHQVLIKPYTYRGHRFQKCKPAKLMGIFRKSIRDVWNVFERPYKMPGIPHEYYVCMYANDNQTVRQHA